MNLTSKPDKLTLPFANAGGKNDIPVASQVGITPGAASFTDGFPPLTRTPISAGGVPPSGLDMNGVLFLMSALVRWFAAGGAFPYDSAFVGDSDIDGYPKGARILRADGAGYWLNTADGNAVDPEATDGTPVTAGWVPDLTNGIAAVTMTNANVTLTPAQYGKPIITISGALVGNLNLIFPAIAGSWIVINNTTGGYTITCKNASGTGVTCKGGQLIIIIDDSVNIYEQTNAAFASSQNVVTGSRALDVVYHNTLLVSKLVTVSISLAGSGSVSSTAVLCDSASSPSTVLISATNHNSLEVAMPLTFVVPPGFYYKVTSGTGVAPTLGIWTEWY